jgi:O-antigen ligase
LIKEVVYLPAKRLVEIQSKAQSPSLFNRAAVLSLGLLVSFGVCTASADHWFVSVFEAGIFLLTFATLQHALWCDSRLKVSRLLLLSAVFPVCGLAQLAAGSTVYRFATGESVLYWATLLCLVFVGITQFQEPAARALFFNCLLILGVAMAVVEVVQLFGSPLGLPMGWPAPRLSSNTYAELCELILPIALTRALLHKDQWLTNAGYCAVLYGTVIASGERMGSILATAEIVAVFGVVRVQRRLPAARWNRMMLALAAFAAICIFIEGAGSLWTRLTEKDIFRGRGDVLISAVSMARDRPWAGHGLGTFPYVYPAYARFDTGYFVNHAHNDWLEAASDGGIVCLAALLSIASLLIVPAVRSIWGIGVAAIFVHAFVDYPLHRMSVAAPLFVLAAGVHVWRPAPIPRGIAIG